MTPIYLYRHTQLQKKHCQAVCLSNVFDSEGKILGYYSQKRGLVAFFSQPDVRVSSGCDAPPLPLPCGVYGLLKDFSSCM